MTFVQAYGLCRRYAGWVVVGLVLAGAGAELARAQAEAVATARVPLARPELQVRHGRRALKDWKFWLGQGVIFAAIAADAHTTNTALRRCPLCAEENVFLGRRPSPARVWAMSLGIYGGGLSLANWGIHKILEHDRPAAQAADFLVPALVGVSSGLAAHRNAQIRGRRVP